MSNRYTLALDDELNRYRALAADARRQEHDAWRAAGIAPGARVADVGCGPAAVLVELARVVGLTGWVDGVDRDPAARAAAARMIAAAGIANARVAAGAADRTRSARWLARVRASPADDFCEECIAQRRGDREGRA
jgi:cyclopropane fatty-acyl-phospholipid synthase-like methyltransferase